MYMLNLNCPHNPIQSFNYFSSDCPLQFSNSLQCTAMKKNAFSMTTKADLAIYYHRAAWSPVPATFITAIQQGYFATWPGLTAALISKHLPKSINTAKGHMKLQRQHVRSTQPPPVLDMPPPVRSKQIFMTILEPKNLLATDLTGRFPVLFSKGSKYVCVCCIYDDNSILVRPMKSRAEAEHIRIYKDIFEYLATRGLRPTHHTMDNECSPTMRHLIVEETSNNYNWYLPTTTART